MKTKLVSFITVFAMVFLPFVMYAQWISLDGSRSEKKQPDVKIINSDESGITVKIDVTGFFLKDISGEKSVNGQKKVHSVDLLTEMFTNKPGTPRIPYIAKIFAVPENAAISAEVVNEGEKYIFDNIHIEAQRQEWTENQPEAPYYENKKVYASNEKMPGTFVKTEKPVIFRDLRLVRLAVYPVQYIPSKNQIQILSSVTVRLKYDYSSKNIVNPKTSAKKPIAPSFGKIYKNIVFNYKDFLNREYNGEESGHDVLLCIMPDAYVSHFQEYAKWKRESGIDIHITKFSEIGASSNNPVPVKQYITDAYNNWEYPPTYVMLVGDAGVFPTKTIVYPDYSFVYDEYFVEIDGNDFLPEMFVGRLTNDNTYKLDVILNKCLKYEKEPYMNETDWYKEGVCCSNNDFASQVATKRFTANIMKNEGQFTKVDTLMSDGYMGGGGCTVHLSDVISAINQGRSFLNYRGEGWEDGWQANCYSFSTNDVSSLNNGRKLTFVTSIGCGVAMFNSQAGNCFGEEWLELGSVSSQRGAIAFVGPTSNTHTTYNNKIDKGIYVGMFKEGIETPGAALLRGKMYMYNVFGSTDPWVEYQFRVFHVLGDPSVHIWRDIPMDITVNYPSQIPVGYSQPMFNVKSTSSGLPVPGAQVTLVSDNLFATGFTDEDGNVYIGITPENTDTLTLTVRGINVYPFQTKITVFQENVHVGPSEYPQITDQDGNNDGNINPNENCDITFNLKNWGTETAENVRATLTTENPEYVEITSTGSMSYGNITAGSTVNGNPFTFHVKDNCPIGVKFTLVLNVVSGNKTWEYKYVQKVKGCKLIYVSNLVNDAGMPKHNFRMDPGETVSLLIWIKNKGEDIAPNVKGILRSNDPYITILDSVGTYGTVNIGEKKLCENNYYVVKVSADCPKGHEAEYKLLLSTQGGMYNYSKITGFVISVAKPVATDPTGPDAYGYYAFSDKDTVFDQAPVYDWFEIASNNLGTKINVQSYVSDYTKTVDLPFDFQYYGQTYNKIRISTDGWLAPGEGTQTAPDNFPLPHNDGISSMIAAFWDDLYDDLVQSDKSGIFYYYDQSNHRFVVEWYDINKHFFFGYETFEVFLLDPDYYPTPTNDGEIIVQYQEIMNDSECTIGIENGNQDIGLQYLYNDIYDSTASTLHANSVIKFTTNAPSTYVSIKEHKSITENKLLKQNYPNPFKVSTSIPFSVEKSGKVSLKVYDINGKEVCTLIDGYKTKGNYSATWYGTGNNGNLLKAGFYFYRLKTKSRIETGKMLKLQ